MSELKLSKSETLKLIDLYRKNYCLWNMKSQLYKRFDLRKKTWESIAEKFKTSVHVVKKKIKFLRTSFMVEKKKVDRLNQSGSAADAYTPKLFYYNDLLFIADTITTRTPNKPSGYLKNSNLESKDNVNEDYMLLDENYAQACKIRSNNSNKAKHKYPSAGSYETKYDETTAAVVGKASVKHSQDDVYMAFATSIALQLKQLPQLDATQTMSDIQKLVSDRTTVSLLSSCERSSSWFESMRSSSHRFTPGAYSHDKSSTAYKYSPASSPTSSRSLEILSKDMIISDIKVENIDDD